MENIQLNDLMNIIEYEKVRQKYRNDSIVYKKRRRIGIGPNITVTFENKRTMKFQIQEMMRAERMVHDHQIEEEVNVYNSLLPKKNELSATLFIEVTDESKIKSILNSFIGLTDGENLYFKIGVSKIPAIFESGREEDDKISSVHYIKFIFNQESISLFKDQNKDVELEVNYKDYVYSVNLDKKTRESLIEDLNGN